MWVVYFQNKYFQKNTFAKFISKKNTFAKHIFEKQGGSEAPLDTKRYCNGNAMLSTYQQ